MDIDVEKNGLPPMAEDGIHAGFPSPAQDYMNKGIDRQTIAEALEYIDTDAAANKLDSVLAAKLRTLSSDPQRRVKLLRFALGRGYGYDEVKSAVDRLLSEED